MHKSCTTIISKFLMIIVIELMINFSKDTCKEIAEKTVTSYTSNIFYFSQRNEQELKRIRSALKVSIDLEEQPQRKSNYGKLLTITGWELQYRKKQKSKQLGWFSNIFSTKKQGSTKDNKTSYSHMFYNLFFKGMQDERLKADESANAQEARLLLEQSPQKPGDGQDEMKTTLMNKSLSKKKKD